MTDSDRDSTIPAEPNSPIDDPPPPEDPTVNTAMNTESPPTRIEPRLLDEEPQPIEPPEQSTPELPVQPPTEPSTPEPPVERPPTESPVTDVTETLPTPEEPPEPAPPPTNEETHVGEISELVSPILEEVGTPPTITDPVPPPPAEDTTVSPPMDIPDSKTSKDAQHRTLLWLVIPIIVLALGLFILSVIYPDIISLLVRAGATLVSVIFLVFIILGVFIIFGLRKEATALMSLIFEGGVKYIDIAEQASKLWDRFTEIIKEMILMVSPVIAGFFAAMFYYLVMFSFRVIGANGDVTLFAILLTIALASLTAFLGQLNIGGETDDESFKGQFGKRFGRVFVDGVEIAVLAIFLTMDMPKLFFLPENLHGTIEAHAFDIDFMQRGFHSEALTVTIRLAGAAVFVEVVRKVYRVVASTREHFQILKKEIERRGIAVITVQQSFEIIRHAARRAFRDSIDDFTKFLGFTTVLVFAFFFFPVLKMLSLFFFNLTNLVWDFVIPKRLSTKSSSEDLFSRILVKILRLENKSD